MTIGEEVRRIRTEAGLTSEKFGEMLGVSKAYISQIERNGRETISFEFAAKICTTFNLPMDHFVPILAPGVTVPPPPSTTQRAFELPNFGDVPCGPPEIQFSNPPGFVSVSESQYGADRFVLRAKGDSMTGRNIQSGDLLIFKRADTADHGDVVVAWTGDGTTVKVYHQRGIGSLVEHWLYPASEHGKPVQMGSEFRIIGVLKAVVREVQPERPPTEPVKPAKKRGK